MCTQCIEYTMNYDDYIAKNPLGLRQFAISERIFEPTIRSSATRFDNDTIFEFPARTVALSEELAENPISSDSRAIMNKIQKYVRYGSHRFSSRLVLFITEKTPTGLTRLKSVLFIINRIPYNVMDVLLRSSSSITDIEMSRKIASIPLYYRKKIYDNPTMAEFLRSIEFANFEKYDPIASARYTTVRKIIIGLATASFGKNIIMENSYRSRETVNFPGGMGGFIPPAVNCGFAEECIYKPRNSWFNPTIISNSRAETYKSPAQRYNKFHTNSNDSFDNTTSPYEHAFFNYEPPCLTAGRETEEETGVPFGTISFLTRNPNAKHIQDSDNFRLFMRHLTRNIHYRDNIVKFADESSPFHPLFNKFSTFVTLSSSMNVHYFGLNFIGFVDRAVVSPSIQFPNNVCVVDRSILGKFHLYKNGIINHTFPESRKAKSAETDYVLSVPVDVIANAGTIMFDNKELDVSSKIRAVLRKIIREISDADYIITDSAMSRIKQLQISRFGN